MESFNRANLKHILIRLPHMAQAIDNAKEDENDSEIFAALALAKIAIFNLTTSIKNSLR